MPTNPPPEDYLPLLRTQQNEAFSWVERAGFDPREFEVGPALWGEGAPCTRFSYRESPYFFDVGTARSSFHVRFSPGMSELLTHQMGLGPRWESVEDQFAAWLQSLRREVEAPDLWAMARDGSTTFFLLEGDVANDPFTEAEIASIEVGVLRAKTYLIESGVTGGALAEANQKLDYLVEAARRTGRLDWRNIAVSTVLSIMISAAFAPDQARVLWETIVAPVRHLLGG